MKRYLADVNVWFALAVEEHRHHRQARAWWDETPGLFGFVRTTQLGLLRLLTSAGPMGGQPLTNQQAWAVYDGFLSDDRVRRLSRPAAARRSVPRAGRTLRSLLPKSGPTRTSLPPPQRTRRFW